MATPRTSSGPTGYVGAIVAGGVSAALFTLALAHAETMLIFIAYLTSIPLFMAGFGAGSLAGLVASVTGMTGLYAVAPSNFAFIYAFLFAVPAVVLIALALRFRIGDDQKIYWYPEGYLLTAIAIYPSLVFLAFAGLLSGHEGGLLAITLDAFKDIAAQVSKQLPPDQVPMLQTVMDRLARMAPAIVGCAWMAITVISMVIAQSLLHKQKWSLRPGFILRELHLPAWLIYAVALIGLLGVLAPAPFDYLGKNLAVLLGLPFFFVGLAVLHAWAATTRLPRIILVSFYIVLTLFVWIGMFVALVGVLDQWVDFRQRLGRTKTPV